MTPEFLKGRDGWIVVVGDRMRMATPVEAHLCDALEDAREMREIHRAALLRALVGDAA